MSNPIVKIRVKGVSKAFQATSGEIVALNNLSLDVAAGEFLMVVGPSGCGKSTLLNLIAGLERPDSGELLMDGQPIMGPSPARSVVFQDGALFPWLTVQGNVEFGLRQGSMGARERRDRARASIEKVGLAGFESHSIHELSGGMRQRTAIARCMAVEPEVILMDEPFSALDAMTREDLYGELQTLYEGNNTTIVFVTHNVREAVTLGDRVIVMSARPARIEAEVSVEILRPREIDDADVAHLAHTISMALKSAKGLPRAEEARA